MPTPQTDSLDRAFVQATIAILLFGLPLFTVLLAVPLFA